MSNYLTCGLWVLNNVVFILRLAGRCGVWVLVPMCDLKHEYVISVCVCMSVL
jgi:hypothetical protein